MEEEITDKKMEFFKCENGYQIISNCYKPFLNHLLYNSELFLLLLHYLDVNRHRKSF